MGFQQGLSGLNTSSKNLAVIGNNVANASTVGFKSGRAEFADVYANTASAGGLQIGIGTKLAAVSTQFSQGNISSSSGPLDVAINGSGLFRLSDNGVISYTRNGQFKLDKNGMLTTDTGANVTGYPADASGNVVASTPGNLQMSLVNMAPKATSAASVGVNLDARSTVPATAFSLTDPTSYNSSTALTAYDTQGNAHTLSLYFSKTAANTWDVHAADDGVILNAGATVNTLNFNTSGALAANQTVNLSLPLANGATTPLAFPLTFTAAEMTQFGVGFGVNKLAQDGYTTGKLAGYAIGQDGTIQGRYDNGQTRAQGQIVLSTFVNLQGLAQIGDNQYTQTSESGQPLTSQPGSGSLGLLQAGALEDANIDLTQELVSMITAQRVYQANAQTIKTEDQVMQTLVNLK
jgi:flagellar hook protein FlgE